jgi:hypothetical protein
MEVYVTGAAFAGLLRTLEESEGDVEGLMFGACMERSFEEISDSSVTSKKRTVVVCIHSFAYSHTRCSFYNEFGHVNCFEVEKLAETCNKDLASIIGWFTFRRNSRHYLSVRERAVHKSFLLMLEHIPRDAFLTALFTPEVAVNLSVHTHSSTLYRTKLGLLEPVPLKVANLHSTSSVAYRKVPSYLTGHEHLEKIASSEKQSLIGEQNQALPIVTLYRNTTKSLEKMKSDLERSSTELHQLALDVKRLEEELQSKETEESRLEEEKQKKLETAKAMGLLIPEDGEENGSGPLIPESQSIVEEFDPL